MAELTLYGRATSANVQKPMWLLDELGVDYTRLDIGGRHGGTDTDEYVAMNPNKLVPTLVDGDLTVWESHAIVRYLAATQGDGRLWVEDPRQRAIVDQWTDWVGSTFQPAWIAVFFSAVVLVEEQRDPDAIAKAVEAAEAKIAIMDRYLRETPWLAGNEFSYADIVAGVCLHRWTTMDIKRTAFEGFDAWEKRLRERSSFEKTVCTSYAELTNIMRR